VMITVWKETLPFGDEGTISIPGGFAGCKFLMANIRLLDGRIYRALDIWFMTDTDAERKLVAVHVRGTGHPIESADWLHVSSVIDGQFVWHIFVSEV
jgi:hypothetical protein